MSYILDALKKAESERKLGGVPSIHAQPPAAASAPHQASWRKPVLWAGLLALALTGGGLAWWQTSLRQAPPTAQVAQTTPPAAPAPQVPQAPQAPQAPPVAAAPEQPAPKPEPPVAKPSRPEPEDIPEAPKPAKPVKRAKPAETDQKAAAKAAPKQEPRAAKADKPAAEPAAKEERIASLRELPDHIQREIPPLIVNGYIYSPNKADRTVLVNGKLVREGDQVAPDLSVERLTQGGMVLNYKGYRYRSSY